MADRDITDGGVDDGEGLAALPPVAAQAAHVEIDRPAIDGESLPVLHGLDGLLAVMDWMLRAVYC
jgi:hypothetical protein